MRADRINYVIILTGACILKHILHIITNSGGGPLNLFAKNDWIATLPPNVVRITRPAGQSPVLLVCEHASSFIPEGLKQLGLEDLAAQSHIAWDPGALAVAEQLSTSLDAPLIAQKISRLVYDCNRPPSSEEAIRAESEVFHIPGNAGLNADQRAAREDYIYRPFQKALAEQVQERAQTVLVTIHTFTPVYNGEARAVEVGILHGTDNRLADAMLDAAAKNPGFKTERNMPYGPEDGVLHTLIEHAEPRGLLNVMIEIRNDLVADEEKVTMVALWLQNILTSALSAVDEDR